MLQRWQIVSNTVSDLTAQGLNRRPPAPEANVLPFDQIAGLSLFSFLFGLLDPFQEK